MQYLPLVADLVLFCFACSSISVAESEKFVKSILCVCVCVCVRARARVDVIPAYVAAHARDCACTWIYGSHLKRQLACAHTSNTHSPAILRT
jgi:hypothetical protein